MLRSVDKIVDSQWVHRLAVLVLASVFLFSAYMLTQVVFNLDRLQEIEQGSDEGDKASVEADIASVLSGCKRGNSLRNEAMLALERENLFAARLGFGPRPPGPGVDFISDCVDVALRLVPNASREQVEKQAGTIANLSTEKD